MKKIILIGGAPATGKSTIARQISEKYSIPWISADFIRNWMKNISSEEKYPNLFAFTNITAEEHYKKYSIEETINMEELRDTDVWSGVVSFIEHNNDWNTYIIEGISIHPKFINSLAKLNYKIIPLFIIENDIKRIHNILYSRGLWGSADTYPDSVKEIEKTYLRKTNDYYLRESIKYEYPYFVIKENRDETVDEIMKYLAKYLKK